MLDSSPYLLSTVKEFMVYSCEHRAIPKAADGLKDAQRKAIWLARNKSEKTKTVSLAGEMISSNLYVHGDQSASSTISMLAAEFCNNIPLLVGIGAFGTRVSPVEGIGAPRYTYVKKGKATQELVFTDLDIIPLKENYDGSAMEPLHFLPLIPLVLLNGVSGIASGWSTEILPRSLLHIIDATMSALDGKKIKPLVPSYDYFDCNVVHLEGNTWQFNGKAKILDTSTVKVTELPPDLTLEKFKERLNSYEDDDKINSYTDRSTKVIDVTVKFSRGSIKDWTEEQVIEFLKLKQRKTERIVVIDWNCKSIRQYESAEQLVTDFVAWRLQWFTVRYQTRLDADQYELKYWLAVKACFDKKLPTRLGNKKDRTDVELDVQTITQKIGIDEKQLDKIVSLPTYRWAKDFEAVVVQNIQTINERILEYKSILSDPDKIKDIYRTELQHLKKVKFNH